MHLKSLPLAACLALAVASGCATPTGTKTPAKTTTETTTKASKPAPTGAKLATDAVLAGSVMAPVGVIAAGGGNVIAAGGGNVIAAGGGNVIAAGGGNLASRQLFALKENPLADTKVFLADAAGNPLPGVKAEKTDAQGRFKFKDIPSGYTFLVMARVKTAEGKEAFLQTMTRPTKLGATADISASTTLVTAALVDGQSDLGEFNAAKFKTAVEATGKNLKPDALPDFADRGAVLAAVRELQAEVAELKSALDEMRQQLKDIQASLDDLKQQLNDQANQALGSLPPVELPPGVSTTEPAVTPSPTAPASGDVSVMLSMPTEYAATRPAAYPVTVAFTTPKGATLGEVQFHTPTEQVPFKLPVGRAIVATYQPATGSQVIGDEFKVDAAGSVRLPWTESGFFVVDDGTL